MNKKFYVTAGTSLLLGSLLASLTMILHPAGGDIDHIIAMASQFRLSHSIGIYTMPLLMFGFLGLTNRLQSDWKVANLAYVLMVFGLLSAALAALLNGVTLPEFLSKYTANYEEKREMLELIMSYGFVLNKGFDFIFITSSCLAIALYSVIIIRLRRLPIWFAVYGLMIIAFAIIGGLTNFAFISVFGFGIVVFAIASWILLAGILLIKSRRE